MQFLLMYFLNHCAFVSYPPLTPEGTITSHLKLIVPPAHTACREAPTPQGKAKCVPERQKQKMRAGRVALVEWSMARATAVMARDYILDKPIAEWDYYDHERLQILFRT